MPEPPFEEIVDYVSQLTISKLFELLTVIKLQLIARGVREDLFREGGYTKP